MNDNRSRRPPVGASVPERSEETRGPAFTEGEYLQDLARRMKPIEVHLRSGEIFHGVIEYYDRRFIRLTRQGEPNLFIFKQDIKYFCAE